MNWLNWLLTPANGLPFLLSLWTMVCMWMAGHNPRRGWMLALIGQVLWFAYTFAVDAWGFLPLNVGLTVIYARNLRRSRDRAETKREALLRYAETVRNNVAWGLPALRGLSVAESISWLSRDRAKILDVLQDLVVLKGLKDSIEANKLKHFDLAQATTDAFQTAFYEQEKPKAWDRARAIVYGEKPK